MPTTFWWTKIGWLWLAGNIWFFNNATSTTARFLKALLVYQSKNIRAMSIQNFKNRVSGLLWGSQEFRSHFSLAESSHLCTKLRFVRHALSQGSHWVWWQACGNSFMWTCHRGLNSSSTPNREGAQQLGCSTTWPSTTLAPPLLWWKLESEVRVIIASSAV